jgi:hypothetical protein
MSGPGRFGAYLRHWHRRLGLFASAFLIWLAVSGVLLNEGARLGLDNVRVSLPLLMHWYGLNALPPADGYAAGGHWLVTTGDATLLDGLPLAPQPAPVLGFAAIDAGGHALLFVATPDSLILLDDAGQRIETLNAATLPMATLRRIGRTADGQVAIQDLDAYASADGETWTPITASAVQWSAREPLPEAQRQRAAPYAQPSLPLLRVLADAHSGRLFGRGGPLLIDLSALAAILLAASGIWMIWRAARRRHHLPLS